MTISSARLMYRPPEPEDLAGLFEIYSDPQTQLFNPAGPMRSADQAEALLSQWIAHWNQHGFGWWVIAEKAAPDHPIGFGGVSHHDYLGEQRLNVGYRFAQEAWGKGYATELGECALRHAFSLPGIERIWAFVRPDHAASIRVLEKIGMQRCGVLDDVPGQPASLLFTVEKAG